MGFNKLSNHDKEYINNNHQTSKLKDIAKHLNINIRTVTRIIKQLNIIRPIKKWTESDKQFLKDNYQVLHITKICSILNRNRNSISKMTSIMKLRKRFNLTEEILRLEYIINQKTVKEISKQYHVSRTAIYAKFKKYNIILEPITKLKSHIDMNILKKKIISSKTRAKKKGLSFNINLEYVLELLKKQEFKCKLSGIDISGNKTISIDRINSKLGYTIDNIQLVHKDVNFMKQSASQEDFIKMCNIISEHNKKE